MSEMDEDDIEFMKSLFKGLLKDDVSTRSLKSDDRMKQILNILKAKYEEAVKEQQLSKTKLLWLHFLDMLEILLNYLMLAK